MGNQNNKVVTTSSKEDTSSVASDISQQSSSNESICRLPTDNQSVTLGSFYNARTDSFLKNSPLDISQKSIKVKSEHNMRIKTLMFPSTRLSGIIDIDAELYLSLILNIAPQIGITSIFEFLLSNDTPVGILYYSYVSQIEYIRDKPNYVRKDIPQSIGDDTITHVVTAIKKGIHVAIVLQLSSNNESDVINLFSEIKMELSENSPKMTIDEEHLPNELNCMKVFSNISDIAELIKLSDVYQKINQLKSEASNYILEYTLEPITSFYPSYLPSKARFIPLNPDLIEEIEKCLYELSMIKKQPETHFDFDTKEILKNHLNKQLCQVQDQISNAEKVHRSIINSISELVLKSRSEKLRQDSSIKELLDKPYKELLNTIKNVSERRNSLQEKAKLITDCEKHGFKYSNIEEFVMQGENTLEIIQQRLLDKNKPKRMFCCTDDLKKQDSSQWNDFYKNLIKERDNNPELDLVYADFSYCSCHLPQMKILASNDIHEQQSSCTSPPLTSSSSSPKLNHTKRINSENTRFINVLLLGESGVGKSTFINALINYLNFESFTAAHLGQPIVLTPVSFLITEGEDFKERIISFGDKDSNENHNNSGQSVTQQCRSYVFAATARTKIRLIDTPGMGDTRGLDQDDLNMQHILSFINNLPHLNAICILLKPNEARLNVVLRSYFTRLVSFLGENVRNNIIFCFTNTRATFFAPGNTGPLLKKMLESQSVTDIPFMKTNTFCLDSESFRYLVARLNRVEFDEYQQEEYEKSWTSSVNESRRLLEYICSGLQAYLQSDWQSIEHAHFQITQLIRPLLETIRNIMRNVIILERSSSKPLIELHSTSLPENSGVCPNCRKCPKFFSTFWVIPDKSQLLANQCDKCSCDLSQQSKIDYLITYETSTDKEKPSSKKLKKDLDRLQEIITYFVYFFKYIIRISIETDPILSALDKMIGEEEYICSKKESDVLNSHLRDKLETMRENHKKLWITSALDQQPITLSDIYNQIKYASENETIREQLNAIKQTQEMYMDEQEKRIS